MWVRSNPDGSRSRLEAVIPDPALPQQTQRLDLSEWMLFKHLYEPFADGFVRWAPSRSARSRIEQVRCITLGWCAFLASLPNGLELQLREITSTLVNGFIVWLDQTTNNGKPKWSVATRMDRLGALRAILYEIFELSKWAAEEPTDLVIPPAPWSGGAILARPTEVLTTDDWRALYLACKTEIAQIQKDYADDWELIERGRARLPDRPTSQCAYRDIEICLAELERTFRGVIPARPSIYAVNPHLDNAIINYHSYTRIARPFYPRPRLLVPFVILIGMHTHANGSLLLRLCENNFSRQEVMGKDRLVWQAFKPRANSSQRRSILVTDDKDNPAGLLEWLRRWTSRIRPFASQSLRNRVFLFVPEIKHKAVTSFMPNNSDGTTDSFNFNLKRFLVDHRLPTINLRMLRATGLDQVRLLFDGDLRAVQAAGGQRSETVIAQRYTSGGARARGAEKIGDIVELQSRWVQTSGKIDPRRMYPGQDRGSATPGWGCLDPLNSPVVGQTEGKLCSAYGACALCPLATTNRMSAYSLVRILQMKALISDSQATLPAERWHLFWAKALKAISAKWLPMFDDPSILKEAKLLHMSPLPPLE